MPPLVISVLHIPSGSYVSALTQSCSRFASLRQCGLPVMISKDIAQTCKDGHLGNCTLKARLCEPRLLQACDLLLHLLDLLHQQRVGLQQITAQALGHILWMQFSAFELKALLSGIRSRVQSMLRP